MFDFSLIYSWFYRDVLWFIPDVFVIFFDASVIFFVNFWKLLKTFWSIELITHAHQTVSKGSKDSSPSSHLCFPTRPPIIITCITKAHKKPSPVSPRNRPWFQHECLLWQPLGCHFYSFNAQDQRPCSSDRLLSSRFSWSVAARPFLKSFFFVFKSTINYNRIIATIHMKMVPKCRETFIMHSIIRTRYGHLNVQNRKHPKLCSLPQVAKKLRLCLSEVVRLYRRFFQPPSSKRYLNHVHFAYLI